MMMDPASKQSFSIEEWCALNNVSRTAFYGLLKAGLAPKTMLVGRRRLISAEAAAAWRAAMEDRATA
jgi:hypothetical protein